MRIAVTCPYFYPRVGGVERYAYNISKRLAVITGNDVTVITSSMSNENDIPFDKRGLHIIREEPALQISSTPVNLNWPFSIARLFRKHQITHALTHTPVPYMSEATVLASRLNNIPCVVTCHEDVENRDAFLNQLYLVYFQLIQKKTFDIADRIIVTSEKLAENSRHLRAFRNKMSIVSPGVDAKVFRPDLDSEWLASRYDLDRSGIVLFVGQMHKASSRKGIDVLIQAFRHVIDICTDAHLMLIGDGDGRIEYEALARRTLPVGSYTFAGKVPEDELPLYYRSASLTVLPSVISEGFGMSLIEAAACGRPTVASNIGGIPYAVQNGVTGILVNPGDQESLASAICAILTDEPLAVRMGAAGRSRAVELFDWSALAHKTHDILESI